MSSAASEGRREGSLAQRSMRGAAWNYSGAVVVILAQLAYTALTARLISPAEFGAYATAQALILLVGFFTLNPVGNAIVRHPALDRQVVGTAIAMTIAAGSIVACVVFVAAEPWANLWRSPGAATLIRLYAPQVVFGALAIVPLSLLRRALRYRTASIIEAASPIIGFSIGGALALELRTAEALVLGQVANACAVFVMSVLTTRSELHLGFVREHARALFAFSAQVSLQNLGHYLNNLLPSFVVSRFLGQTSLGYYSRGWVLVSVPLNFLAQGVYKTLYPVYPRFRERERECRRMMADVTSVAMTVVWLLFAALAGLAPLVVEILLGTEWARVATVVSPLCLFAALNFAYWVYASFAESFGLLRQIWFAQVCWTVTLAIALITAVELGATVREIVLVAAVIQLPIHALQVALLARVQLISAMATLRAELGAALVAATWFIATAATMRSVENQELLLRIPSAAGVLALLTAATLVALPHIPAGRALSRRGIDVGLRRALFL